MLATIKSALESIKSSLPSVAKKMTVGDMSGIAVLASSVQMGLSVSSNGAEETRKVVAQFADFPHLDTDALVNLDDEDFLITSLRSTADAVWSIGLSAPLTNVLITYRGKRKREGKLYNILQPIGALAVEEESYSGYSDGLAPAVEMTWRVVIREKDWLDPTRPEIADTLDFIHHNEVVKLVVTAVSPFKGYYTLTARTK